MKITLLAFFSALLISVTQAQTIKGKVKDAKNQPLIGAVVLVEGTTKGAQTDLDGNYNIAGLTPGKYKLKFQYVGLQTAYKNVELVAGQDLTFDFSMQEDPKQLDEAIVIGYGTQKRREVTSSVAKISQKELNDLPVQSFEQAMQGKLAGVQVTQGSGVAGSPSIIRIRGISSISAGGDPLYVIDGIPITQDYGAFGNTGGANFNPLATINPNDIESVEVLKDAAATSIYGSRGSNGVIMITTRRAEKGKLRVTYSGQVGISTPTAKPKMVSRDELLNLYEEAWINDGHTGKPNLEAYGIKMNWDDAHNYNTNWYDQVTQTGIKNQHDISIMKGWDKVSLYTSFSYGNNETFLKGNSYERISGRINLDYQITKKLKMQFGTSLTNGTNNRVFSGWSGGYGSVMSSALPFYPVKNPDGSYFTFNSSDGGLNVGNPVMWLNLYKWQTKETRSISNLALNYEIIKNLSARVQGSYDYQSIGDDNFVPEELNRLASGGSNVFSISTRNAKYTGNYNVSGQLTYHYELNKLNKFDITGGYERQRSLTNSFLVVQDSTSGYITSNEKTSSNLKDIYIPTEWRFERYFGRVSFNSRDRYFVQAAFSYDGSSRFGDNNRYGFFPSLSAGWILTEESFLRDNKKVTFLKVRASYGRSGNSDFDANARFGFFRASDAITYNGQTTLFPEKLENADLRWETSWTFNTGLDFGLFNDKLTGTFDFYDKRTNDVIMNLTLDRSAGFSDYYDNVGSISNRGVELSLKTTLVQTDKFRWVIQANIARNINAITSTGDYTEEAVSGGTNDTRVVVGSPVGTYYLVRFSRVDPESGRPIYLDKSGNETFTWNPDNRVAVGSILPDAIGGFTNNFRYKNWDLSVLFVYQIGGSIYDASAKRQMGVMSFWNSRPEIADRWQKPGDQASFPRLTFDAATYGVPNYWQYNTPMWLYDASFLRLRNLTVGYNIPAAWAKKVKMSSARVAFIGTNLLVFTNYPGLDPEIARDGEGNVNTSRNMQAQGTYYLNAPQERTYNFQIIATF